MRSLTLYTRVMLKGSCRGRGYNSTFALLSCAVTTNTERLCLRRLPFLQLVDILSIDIPSVDILFIDILFADIPFIDILFIDILFTS